MYILIFIMFNILIPVMIGYSIGKYCVYIQCGVFGLILGLLASLVLGLNSASIGNKLISKYDLK